MNSLVLLIVIFAVMMLPMFWMSSRQRKMQRKQQEALAALEIGDEVRTHSGFYGLLVEQYDDVVVLETESGAHTKWARAALSGKVEAPATGMAEEESDTDADDGGIPGVTTRTDQNDTDR